MTADHPATKIAPAVTMIAVAIAAIAKAPSAAAHQGILPPH